MNNASPPPDPELEFPAEPPGAAMATLKPLLILVGIAGALGIAAVIVSLTVDLKADLRAAAAAEPPQPETLARAAQFERETAAAERKADYERAVAGERAARQARCAKINESDFRALIRSIRPAQGYTYVGEAWFALDADEKRNLAQWLSLCKGTDEVRFYANDRVLAGVGLFSGPFVNE